MGLVEHVHLWTSERQTIRPHAQIAQEETMKTMDEAHRVIEECDVQIVEGTSRYRSMTYEEGVIDAIIWVFGGKAMALDEPEGWPFEDEPG